MARPPAKAHEAGTFSDSPVRRLQRCIARETASGRDTTTVWPAPRGEVDRPQLAAPSCNNCHSGRCRPASAKPLHLAAERDCGVAHKGIWSVRLAGLGHRPLTATTPVRIRYGSRTPHGTARPVRERRVPRQASTHTAENRATASKVPSRGVPVVSTATLCSSITSRTVAVGPHGELVRTPTVV